MRLEDRVADLEDSLEVVAKWAKIALYVSMACATALGLEIADVLR
jgi:hypothetical protein